MASLASIVQTVATIISIFMLGSPIITVRNMEKSQSVGVVAVTFFCAQYANCVSWGMYGVQLDAAGMIVCNIFGVVVATYCISVYLSVARLEENSEEKRTDGIYKSSFRSAVFTFFLMAFFLLLIVALRVSGNISLALIINGTFSATCSVVMLSSPLMMAGDIIKNQNAEGLQPITMFFGTANSAFWLLYGLLTVDFFVITPNALCLIACLFQFGLLLKYGKKPSPSHTVSGASLPI